MLFARRCKHSNESYVALSAFLWCCLFYFTRLLLTFASVDRIFRCEYSNETIEQYFSVVLFIMLYKVVLTFESVDEILSVTIQMKATEQYFPVVLFIMLYKVVLTCVCVWMKSSSVTIQKG